MAKADPFAKYTRANQPCKARIIASSSAEVGAGKTHWWFGAPGPIVVHSFDNGTKGVVEKFQDDKEIYVEAYDWLPDNEISQQEAIDLRDHFTEMFEDSITKARTIIVDRETDLWEIYRYAEFGAVNDSPKEYAGINKRYRKLVNSVKALDNVNLGILRGMKDIWSSKVNQNTGKMGLGSRSHREPAGMREVEALVDVNLEHYVIADTPARFGIRVGKARGPGSEFVQYQEFESLSFSEFGQLLFPDTSDEEWL